MDLVSILIPTYNQPEFFRKALKSALNQDYQNIEILVGDDSTDNRVKNVVDEFLQQPQKFPIKYIKHSSEGERLKGYANQVNLLSHAQGEYISFLLHDDLFMPNKISRMMEYFKDNAAFVTSNRYIIDENDNILDIWGIDDEPTGAKLYSSDELCRRVLLLSSNFIGEPTTVLFRRRDICKDDKILFGYFIGKFFPWLVDLPTWFEFARNYPVVPFLTEPLSAYRKHSQQNTENYTNIFGTFVERAGIISTSYINDIFIHDFETLKKCCDAWLKTNSLFINARGGNISYEQDRFQDIDLLLNLFQLAEKQDYEQFLKLSLSNF